MNKNKSTELQLCIGIIPYFFLCIANLIREIIQLILLPSSLLLKSLLFVGLIAVICIFLSFIVQNEYVFFALGISIILFLVIFNIPRFVNLITKAFLNFVNNCITTPILAKLYNIKKQKIKDVDTKSSIESHINSIQLLKNFKVKPLSFYEYSHENNVVTFYELKLMGKETYNKYINATLVKLPIKENLDQIISFVKNDSCIQKVAKEKFAKVEFCGEPFNKKFTIYAERNEEALSNLKMSLIAIIKSLSYRNADIIIDGEYINILIHKEYPVEKLSFFNAIIANSYFITNNIMTYKINNIMYYEQEEKDIKDLSKAICDIQRNLFI